MSEVSLRLTTPEDAEIIIQLMEKYWGGEPLVIRAKKYYPSKLSGILATRGAVIVGFLFYERQGDSCEIVVLEVLDKFKGIGTQLLDKLKRIMAQESCQRIYLMTGNDNLDALRFYQKRGFHICAIHLDAMKASRELKPHIPMIGDYGIPLRDEIDLELILTDEQRPLA